MYRLTKVTIFALFLFTKINGQKIKNNFGANVYAINLPTINATVVHYSLVYFPQISLKEFAKSSITIGSPLGIGLFLERGDWNTVTNFSFDIPIVIDYNLMLTNKKNKKNSGCYFGLGLSYNYYSFKNEIRGNFSDATFGFLYRAGIKFKNPIEIPKFHINSIGLYHLNGMENPKLSATGLSVFYGL